MGILQIQFGQEYRNMADFKKKLLTALKQAKAVYPDARLDLKPEGIMLSSSKLPIPRLLVQI